jgi:hypothetical protein
MSNGKTVITGLSMLVLGFTGGFVLRPVISSTQQTARGDAVTPAAPVSGEVRGTQYFVAHIDEARQVAAGCRDGSVRGGECATAEEAIIKVDAAERRKRFIGN